MRDNCVAVTGANGTTLLHCGKPATHVASRYVTAFPCCAKHARDARRQHFSIATLTEIERLNARA